MGTWRLALEDLLALVDDGLLPGRPLLRRFANGLRVPKRP
jgi:hypothetical protein